ncbi:MAG: hypothetical protein KBB23_09355 [Smithella sp.]|nr:hypothetical protein [Smithella sp.]
MKKIVVCVVVMMFLVTLPFVALAKKVSLTEEELSATTAQEGVTIDFGGDNFFQTNLSIRGNFAPALQSWGDGDGCTDCGGYTAKGWIGVRNVTMSPYVQMAGNFTNVDPYGIIPLTGPSGSFISLYRDMTIDVGTSGGATKVFVGLPSIMVHPAGISQTISSGTTETLGQDFGTAYMSEFAMVVNSLGTGYLAISNHSDGSEGVEIQFNSTAAAYGPLRGVMFSIPGKPIVQSWSDTDGEQTGSGYTNAGYFGAKNFTMSDGTAYSWPLNSALFNIFVTGTLSIDVGTNGSGQTAVVLGVPTVFFAPNAAITSPFGFATDRELNTNWQSLGTLYTAGIDIHQMRGSLAISAH